jgi:branched-chain amino acid transport system substrate-binding protein
MSLLLLLSCTQTGFELKECETTPECRTAFGLGFTCGAEGLCESEPVPDRCTTTEPSGLWENPENYPDVIVFGSL